MNEAPVSCYESLNFLNEDTVATYYTTEIVGPRSRSFGISGS